MEIDRRDELHSRDRARDQSLPDFRYTKIIETPFGVQEFTIGKLPAPPFGIHASVNHHLWLDCHNLSVAEPVYRPHMFTSDEGGADVPYETKLARIVAWQNSILVFDSRMIEMSDVSPAALMEAFKEMKLPRAAMTELATSVTSLRTILKELGAIDRAELILPWEVLCEAAKIGEIEARWKAYKARTHSSF